MKPLLLYRKTFAILILYVGISHLIKTAIRWNEIAPYSNIGWHLEQVGLGILIMFSGLVVGINPLVTSRQKLLGFFLSVLQTAFFILIFSRYFWYPVASLIILNLMDCLFILICFSPRIYLKIAVWLIFPSLPFVLFLLQLMSMHSHEGDIEFLRTCPILEKHINDQFNKLVGKENVFIALETQITRFEKQNLDEEYCSEVFRNIDKKRSLERGGYVITADKLIRHTIQYSGFKIETYLSSGVAPKQYFGFLDEIGDTAYYERILRQTVIDVVKITNDYAQRSGLKTRISEKEITVTFIAEGGALLLTTPELSPDKVHPVRGIGLDDLKSGLNKYPSLIDEYDRFFGSKLKDFLLLEIAGRAVVTRPMTFKESILGTALMYLYEKEITAKKMNDEWHEDLMSLPLSQQFISTSLVYNSGILFSKERVEQIEQFATGDYLAKINQESNRKKLPIYTPQVAFQRLKNGEPIPQQLTSWNAVYHVLQRYGAWVAIERFAGVLSFLLTYIMLNLQI